MLARHVLAYQEESGGAAMGSGMVEVSSRWIFLRRTSAIGHKP